MAPKEMGSLAMAMKVTILRFFTGVSREHINTYSTYSPILLTYIGPLGCVRIPRDAWMLCCPLLLG